jgi:hypothetical protein
VRPVPPDAGRCDVGSDDRPVRAVRTALTEELQYVFGHNSRARALYESLGFEIDSMSMTNLLTT